MPSRATIRERRRTDRATRGAHASPSQVSPDVRLYMTRHTPNCMGMCRLSMPPDGGSGVANASMIGMNESMASRHADSAIAIGPYGQPAGTYALIDD